MVQRSPSQQWEATGLLARVAAPQRVVTNFHKGGTPHEVYPILTKYLTRDETVRYTNQLCRLGEKVALHFNRSFPYLQDLGLDVAIDQDMRAWILEVNTRPLADVFKKLKDQTMFKRICRYGEAYGRYYFKPGKNSKRT